MPDRSKFVLLKVKSDPCHIPESVLANLGFIAIEWGRIENLIAQDISMMMQKAIVNAIRPDRTPVAFKRRLDLWKRCLSTLHKDRSQIQDIARALCKEAVELSGLRNHLLHGVWEIKEAASDQSFNVVSIRSMTHVEAWDEIEITANQVAMLRTDISALSDQFLGFLTSRIRPQPIGPLQ